MAGWFLPPRYRLAGSGGGKGLTRPRHCERSEAIHTVTSEAVWIASSLALLAMTIWLQQIAARRQSRRAVLAEGLDDVAADFPFVHFVGPVHQPLRAHLGVPLGERRILGKAERAVKLDRGVDHMMHHVREEHFRDRVLLPEVEPLLRLVGDMQQHQ